MVKKAVNELMENGVLVSAEHPKPALPQEHRDDVSVPNGSTGEWVGLVKVCK